MALLSAHKLCKAFGGRSLFQDVSFEVGNKAHIGLCGQNGTGKTTLLNILQGLEQPDSGEVHRAKLIKIGTMAQLPALSQQESVYELVLSCFAPVLALEEELRQVGEALEQSGAPYEMLVKKQAALQERYQEEGGLTCRSRARAALLGLGFSEEELSMRAAALSGGQLNKVMLARVLLEQSDLLLLDEPTNHLDIAAVEWLEGFLKSYTGAFIVVSHDRYFLDQVTNRTMELTHTGFYVSEGNYTRHVELRLNEQEYARRKYNNTQKEIRRIYGIVEQQRRWNRERNIRTAESKLKQIARLEATLVEPEKQAEGIHFTFRAQEAGGNDVLLAEGLSKAYGEKKLFSDVALHIRKEERVFLLGPNGCGKTTLLNILANRLGPDAGSFSLGAGVRIAYYEQHMRGMREENTVLQEIWDAYPRLGKTQVHNALAAFLFRGEDAQKKISMLSGGERARVQLLKLMLSGANLLLLDEPTNHLDIASREALEQALEEFNGAYMVVTHDRYLVNRLADRVLYMEPGCVRESIGGYDAFLESLQQQPQTVPPEENIKERPQNDYLARKERQAELARLRGEVSALEKRIAAQEERIETLEAELAEVAAAQEYQPINALLAQLEGERAGLEEVYGAWERAAGEMEALRQEQE